MTEKDVRDYLDSQYNNIPKSINGYKYTIDAVLTINELIENKEEIKMMFVYHNVSKVNNNVNNTSERVIKYFKEKLNIKKNNRDFVFDTYYGVKDILNK